MIGRLVGRVAWKGADQVLIDCHGVGYVVHASARTIAALPPEGEMATLYTDLQVREDLLQLYGFASMIEREWHRLLMTVQGVGARASMAILGTLGAEGVARAIVLGDAAAMRTAPGIGPRISQRVILELEAKAPALMAAAGRMAAVPATDAGAAGAVEVPDTGAVSDAGADAPARPAGRRRKKKAAPAVPSAAERRAADRADALSALINLGYAPGDAAAAIATVATDDGEDAGEAGGVRGLIRRALKQLAPE